MGKEGELSVIDEAQQGQLEQEAWEQEELKRIKESLEPPFDGYVEFVNFESRSRGRNRIGQKIPRKPRQVALLAVRDGKGFCYTVTEGGEIHPTKKRKHVAPDVLLNDLLSEYPPEERTPEKLFSLLYITR